VRLAVKDTQIDREHQQHEDVKPYPQPNLIHNRSSSLTSPVQANVQPRSLWQLEPCPGADGMFLTENKKDEAFF
jgi:hypothetical protein